MAFDGDAIAVVNPTEIGQSQMARKRSCFAGDSLHHVAVPAKRVDVEVEHVEAGPIVILGKKESGYRHPNASGHSLTKRTSRSFDPRCPTIFRMTWTTTSGLPERLDIVERY